MTKTLKRKRSVVRRSERVKQMLCLTLSSKIFEERVKHSYSVYKGEKRVIVFLCWQLALVRMRWWRELAWFKERKKRGTSWSLRAKYQMW